MFDLDRFRASTIGTGTKEARGACILSVGEFSLRPNDLFGRIGGKECASLLPATGHHDAVWLAERVRSAVETSSHAFGQNAFELTVSVGVAISDEAKARPRKNACAQRLLAR